MIRGTRLILATWLVTATGAVALADWDSAMAAYDEGEFATAVVEFQAQVETRPHFAGAHYMLGESLRRSGSTQDAVHSLRQAVELEPDNLTYRLGLVQGLVSAELFDDAVAELEALPPDPLTDEQRRARAMLLAQAELSRGRSAAAVAALEAEPAAVGDDAPFQRLLGHSLVRTDRREDAVTAFARAFELEPHDAVAGRAAVELALAVAAATSDRAVRERYAERAVAIAETLAAAGENGADLARVARCLHAARAPGRALPWVERALEVSPDDPELLFVAGWALRCAGRTVEAVRRLRSALDRGAEDRLKARVHGQLARIAEGRSDLEEAVREHRLAGDTQRARQLEEVLAASGASVRRLNELRAQVDEVSARLVRLEALGQSEAAAQVRARVSVLETEAASIEANLAEVRRALEAGSDCR